MCYTARHDLVILVYTLKEIRIRSMFANIGTEV